MQYCLAADVAAGKSMFCLASEQGEVLQPPTEYEHNFPGLMAVLEMLNRLDGEDIHIIMESTSIYHLPVARFFREHSSYNLIIINPIISKENKFSLRKTKTDKSDCRNLIHIFFTGAYNQQSILWMWICWITNTPERTERNVYCVLAV